MKKFFLNSLIIAALVASAAIVVSCDKDKDKDDDDKGGGGAIDKITAIVEDGANYNNTIDVVKVMGNVISGGWTEIATENYSDGGFTIDFPKTLDAKFTAKISSIIIGGDKLTISNPDALISDPVRFEGWKQNLVCRFEHRNDVSPRTEVWYRYVNSDVNISGTYVWVSRPGTEDEEEWTDVYSCKLKKGWNVMYYTRNNSSKGKIAREYTTNTVSGVKWYYSRW